MNRICALVVTHNPDLRVLRSMLEAVAPQVAQVLVVDNASAQSPAEGLADLSPPPGAAGLEWMCLAQNQGLAEAQNRGARWAEERGFSHLLLLDQDSEPEAGMVPALLRGWEILESAGHRVGAVGPVYTDPRTGNARHFVRFPGWSVERERCSGNSDAVATDFLIASGTLVSMAVWSDVGCFRSELFIDNVDLEWCFRARGAGYALFGICAARMRHSVGDRPLRVWLGRWWYVHRHSPLRQYYMARNRVFLYRQRVSPKGWILQDGLRFLAKLFWFGIVFAP